MEKTVLINGKNNYKSGKNILILRFLGQCPIHILAIGPTIDGDLKFHDRPRFTVLCDCKFRYTIYYDATTTYWPGKRWLRITKIVYESQRLTRINCGQSFSIIASPRQSFSIVFTRSNPLPFVTFPSKLGIIHGQSWKRIVVFHSHS